MDLSVIICTHNPREDYLRRVLGAINAQTLPKEHWELLLIDNASSNPIGDRLDFSWHPKSQIIREDELGLTPSRLRGIKEANGELLLFVDDDNVLDPDYLSKGLEHFLRFPQLGAVGPGIIVADYESAPSAELVKYANMLALRNEERTHWSNQVCMNISIPYGAGLFVRKIVAQEYAHSVRSDSARALLGRSGTSLLSGEDIDIGLTACSMGFGTAVFPDLRLDHLIPAKRVQLDYFVRIAEGHEFSHYVLSQIWNYAPKWMENPIASTWRHLVRLFRLKGADRQIYLAKRRGRAKGETFWREFNLGK